MSTGPVLDAWVPDEALLDQAVHLTFDPRRVGSEDRAWLTAELTLRGWSEPRIAQTLRISERQVRRLRGSALAHQTLALGVARRDVDRLGRRLATLASMGESERARLLREVGVLRSARDTLVDQLAAARSRVAGCRCDPRAVGL